MYKIFSFEDNGGNLVTIKIYRDFDLDFFIGSRLSLKDFNFVKLKLRA